MKTLMRGKIVAFSVIMCLLASGALVGCSSNDTAQNLNEHETQDQIATQEDVANESDTNLMATKTNKAVTSNAEDAKKIEQAIFEQVNKERKKAGKKELKWDDTLYKACAVRAKEVTTKFSHTRPNNSTCFTAITQAGLSYRSAAENIATGQTTADQVMKGWMNSAGHKKNILSDNTTFACAVIANPSSSKYGGYSFVQLFCTKK